ncbi:aliphatic sulfonate ABC transporter substrate-binding protein [Robbsia sp. Bb-Pol-6]|uniref:Aliphatic sulfonate ABC transporter substrate-binding protein n=1 Tax=Robbsia betulipollinis TaxID=2981849 RepID=A0ABT3ZI30_9BURK|nr:aliphatic sulfonate ABC transporter substrate-binding protein [Robbsia betulipollinis]MCY0386184.1 aliphatic sulfonate ABC transporter substrate-binding protein [Robbsia betulipollinis]
MFASSPAARSRYFGRTGVLSRIGAAAAFAFAACVPTFAHAAPAAQVTLDYAYYSPESLVIKQQGWLEAALAPEHTQVKWILSLGSNRALEYLNSGAIDIGSSAGLAAVLAKANGNPIKAVYVFSRPEWTALVVGRQSPIRTLADLKGKKIAATVGTDPFLFTLRALHTIGLGREDVELVNLQHPDGRTALAKGQVDAWAGLDPHMAAAQVDDGARLLYRNVDYNTYGFLNAREDFIKAHPETLTAVLKVYDKARVWVIAHPAETARILAEASKVSLPVAQLQLSRNDFSQPVPGATQAAALKAAAPILLQENLVRPGTQPDRVIDALIDGEFARSVAPAAVTPAATAHAASQ